MLTMTPDERIKQLESENKELRLVNAVLAASLRVWRPRDAVSVLRVEWAMGRAMHGARRENRLVGSNLDVTG